jgi:hypothetical protein
MLVGPPVAGAIEAKAGCDQEEVEDDSGQTRHADSLNSAAGGGDCGSSKGALPPVEATAAPKKDQEVDVRLSPRVLPAWADKVPQGITSTLPVLLALAAVFNPATEAASSAPFLFGGLSLAAAAEGLKYYGESHAIQAQVR